MNIVPRTVALEQGCKRFFTGKPCCSGHVAERIVSNGRCVECANLSSRKWKKEHRHACTAESRQWRANNREHVREIKRAFYAESPNERAKQAIRSRKWLDANRQSNRDSQARWRDANRAIATAAANRRRARLLQRTPIWADHDKIRQFYIKARDLTEQTGVEHHVDHIIPLQGKLVCGLHVETNLQILTANANRSKGARFVSGWDSI